MNSNPSIIIMPTDTVTKKYNTRSAMAKRVLYFLVSVDMLFNGMGYSTFVYYI